MFILGVAEMMGMLDRSRATRDAVVPLDVNETIAAALSWEAMRDADEATAWGIVASACGCNASTIERYAWCCSVDWMMRSIISTVSRG